MHSSRNVLLSGLQSSGWAVMATVSLLVSALTLLCLMQVKEEEQEAAKFDAIFPCILKILPNCVFNKKDPIIVGVEIAEGIAKV